MNTMVADRRPLGALGRIGMVAGLHVAALYLIAASLGVVPPLIKEPERILASVVESAPPVETPDPVAHPRSYEPRVYVPPPVAPPAERSDSGTDLTVNLTDNPQEVPPPIPTVPETQIVGVRVDARHPLSQPAYPPSDIRAGREGTAEIEVYVLPNGRVGDVRIVKSAGSPTLDQSAIDEARRRWRLLPATRDGEPYAQWHRLKVTFNLRNR